jgi:hypothetical protein
VNGFRALHPTDARIGDRMASVHGSENRKIHHEDTKILPKIPGHGLRLLCVFVIFVSLWCAFFSR